MRLATGERLAVELLAGGFSDALVSGRVRRRARDAQRKSTLDRWLSEF
jgi:hypothetical protein